MLSFDQQSSYSTHYHQPPSSAADMTVTKRLAGARHKHLFIVTGPAGCGKTTIAEFLADWSGLPYLEGDDYHPQSNVDKMSQGVALTDADRWDWLIQLREEAVLALDAGAAGVILTCSALKRKYRDVIRVARYNDHDVRVHFIYLRATEALLTASVAARKGHYMKPGMVRSQLQSLEEPSVERERDVHSIDVSGTQSEVREMAVEVFESVMLDDWHAMD